MKHVYFIRRADGLGPIKIGCSRWPEDRRRQIGYDVRAETVILAVAPGGLEHEGEVHRRFSAHRTENPDLPKRAYPVGGRTEWFSPVPELLSLIEKVAATGKLPPEFVSTRDATICTRRAAGETLQAIANDVGLTRERVRQIVSETKAMLARRKKAA